MKTFGIWVAFLAAVGVGVVPVITRNQQTISAQQRKTQAVIQQTSGYSAGPPIYLVPTVPEFQAFGQIHVNGQVAFEQGPATGTIMVGGIPCCRHRIWKTQQWPLVEVHRVLAEDGSGVSWWAVLLDALWQPKNLNGMDYNCSGGGFNITP